MKVETKRIFISDLPETITPDDLKDTINNYGNVTSIEIKERKELGLKNHSLFFSYINVEVDDGKLQQCFKDFANSKWFGQHIALQIARESFLERLKREREETCAPAQKNVNVSDSVKIQQYPTKQNGLKLKKTEHQTPTNNEIEESDSSSDGSAKKTLIKSSKQSRKDNSKSNVPNAQENDGDINETLNLIIKNNKGKIFDKKGLQIESVGYSPILKIDNSKKKVVNLSEANLKRLQSLSNLKKAHKAQKSAIQQALSKIDITSQKKIIFDDNDVAVSDSNPLNDKSKLPLSDEESEDDFTPIFEKDQFQGEKGQKLLELQSRYKNDKRFGLDKRFLEENENQEENTDLAENNEDMSFEEEKKKEYEILEQVLGKKVLPKFQHKTELGRYNLTSLSWPAAEVCLLQYTAQTNQKKIMLRFDPTQPEHSKFEMKNEAKKEKKKRKRDTSESDILQEKKQEEKAAPEVSKEIFYKVTDDLKDSLKEKEEFSLLSMFGKANEKEQRTEETFKQSNTNNFVTEENPFRYDSSDNEDETGNIPSKEDVQQTENLSKLNQHRTTNRSSFWSEPFFFTDDDYRFQEGIDFVEKMSSKEDNDFTKLRRDLKGIVKAKVRNNQRKNRPFKKKLGGSKKKKMLRIKRALKR